MGYSITLLLRVVPDEHEDNVVPIRGANSIHKGLGFKQLTYFTYSILVLVQTISLLD